MRKLVALVASTAALLIGSIANAAPVDVVFTQTAPGAPTWSLSINVPDAGVQISAVSFLITSSPAADFVITAAAANVDPFTTSTPSGFSVKDLSGNTLHLSMVAGTNGIITTGPGSFLLGTLTGAGIHSCGDIAACAGQWTPGDDDGGTIQDQDFASLDYTVRFVGNGVPEPGALLLLGLGIAGLSVVRRKA